MAERRMFTKKITDDDHFSSLSSSAQALYFHLSMSADDDGFCNQVSLCMFKAHASVGDVEALLQQRYIYQFDNGVIVIKHWRMANILRSDRYTPTNFKEEMARLSLDRNKAYVLKNQDIPTLENQDESNWLPSGCQLVADCLPQNRIEENSIDKVNIKEKVVDKSTTKKKVFVPPTLEEVKQYCKEVGSQIDAEAFVAFYDSKGWFVGKTKMVSWKSAIVTWEKSKGLKRIKPKTDNTPVMENPEPILTDEEWLEAMKAGEE